MNGDQSCSCKEFTREKGVKIINGSYRRHAISYKCINCSHFLLSQMSRKIRKKVYINFEKFSSYQITENISRLSSISE